MQAGRGSIRRYYDQNTRWFLAFNRHRSGDNIHRSLWPQGVKTLRDALDVTNELIRLEIESLIPTQARIADLGCGVGASLFYIVPRLQEPRSAVGLTLSSVQARLAGHLAKKAALEDRILFAEGDFEAAPMADGSLDVIYSVEAVVHLPEPGQYFQEAARLLRSGGRLILVDDYLKRRPRTKNEIRWLNAYMKGWNAPGVKTIDQTIMSAQKNRLEMIKNENLSQYLRLRSLPDTLARFLLFVGNRIPIEHALLSSMLGSMALQQCLHQQVVEYRLLVFDKSAVGGEE